MSEDPESVATIEDVRRLHDVPDDDATGEGYTVVAVDSGIDPARRVFEGDTVGQVDATGSGEGDAVGHGTAVTWPTPGPRPRVRSHPRGHGHSRSRVGVATV